MRLTYMPPITDGPLTPVIKPPAPKAAPAGRAAIALLAERSCDAVAAALARWGASPNGLTVAGFLVSLGGAALLVIGAGHVTPWSALPGGARSLWPAAAAGVLALGFTLDLLDGAVARASGSVTPFGAVLDSSLDRVADVAMFAACGLHFAAFGNVTYVALSFSAACAALLISYVKARAENLIDHCRVGYWQRGERCAAFLIAAVLGHVPAALWLLGTLPLLTAWKRLRHVRRELSAGPAQPSSVTSSASAPRRPPPPSRPRLAMLRVWRHRRGSAGYVICAVAWFAFLLMAPRMSPWFRANADPVRTLLEMVSMIPPR